MIDDNGKTVSRYKKGQEVKTVHKTWCTYEHRNSDNIIINSKEGWAGGCVDVPYGGGSKYDYDASFSYEQYEAAAQGIIDLIIEYRKTVLTNQSKE